MVKKAAITMSVEVLKAAGFKETRYPDQEGVFWKKTLKARDMPYVREHLVGEECEADDEVWVEVIPGDGVQMGITGSSYFEEPVPVSSEDGRGLLRDAGVAV